MTKAIDDAADMPKEIYIEKNGTTIHGEKVIPPFSAHTYSTNPLNGKEYTKYTRATPPQPKDVQGALDAFHLQIAEYRATKKVHNTNKYDQSIRHYQTAITALMQCQGWQPIENSENDRITLDDLRKEHKNYEEKNNKNNVILSALKSIFHHPFSGVAYEMDKNIQYELIQNDAYNIEEMFRYPSFTINVWPNGKCPTQESEETTEEA